jgi:hypothetical protein
MEARHGLATRCRVGLKDTLHDRPNLSDAGVKRWPIGACRERQAPRRCRQHQFRSAYALTVRATEFRSSMPALNQYSRQSILVARNAVNLDLPTRVTI